MAAPRLLGNLTVGRFGHPAIHGVESGVRSPRFDSRVECDVLPCGSRSPLRGNLVAYEKRQARLARGGSGRIDRGLEHIVELRWLELTSLLPGNREDELGRVRFRVGVRARQDDLRAGTPRKIGGVSHPR